ncbi:MAG: PBP1A family penicillin-binding protein, partial [Cyanobacteria bacterium K_DeepCast_35m_m2_023]|nr:PBP1A family penicillin-binding protein [Cyanobacteria bacterium K_DeepCast_35m_m2_023]
MTPATTPPNAPPGRFDWKRTVAAAALIGAGVALGQAALVAGIDALLPDARRVGSFNRPGTLTILSADGEVIQKIGPATREKLTPESLPTLIEQAFIAAEDRRFYQHDGIDPVGIGRAIVRNITERSVEEGASTITQQLARTVFLSQDISLVRKFKEAALAGKLERHLSKRQILTEYLNVVYLGSSAYGVADAAWIYFSKTPSQLTLPEAALIAGMPPAPSVYSPLVNPELALRRRSIVLRRMEEAGSITAGERADAEATPLELKPAEPKFWVSQAPWFSSWVQQELPRVLSKEQLEVGGLTVRSSLNLSWQQQAQTTINQYASGPMEGALVAMEPGTGMVRAMVGGKDFSKSQFNRAAQALRSPGSTFKLFVYLTALKAGMLPERSVVDLPQCFKGYCPRNFGGRYLGRVSLATALQNSLNTVAVLLLRELGFDKVIETAKSLGITRELGRFYPMAIGAYEQTLLDMTAAYAAITNRGIYVQPTPFEDILGPDGQLLWSRRVDGDRGRRAVASDIADTMLWMLQQVVKGGTGGGAALSDRPVAGKTGTSEGGRDLWFIGSIAQLTTGIWLGYDDSRETKSTSVVATLAWHDFMAPISKTLPVRQFPPKPQLNNSYKPVPTTTKPEPGGATKPASEGQGVPAAPELPQSFTPVPEGTPTDGPPQGPGAPRTVAPAPGPAQETLPPVS